MSAVKNFKKEAPKWTTYFPKKQREVIYRILFYANNPAHIAFASYATLMKDCACSHMTVYRAILLACSLGIIENKTTTACVKDYKNNLTYFHKRLKIKWVGDVVLRKSDAFISLNVNETVNENVSLYNKIRNSLKREEAPVSFSLEKKIEEQLKEYPENLRDTFKNHLESKYENKRHFIPIDFKEQLERFKKHNPLRKCSKCKEVNFKQGSLCDTCLVDYQEQAIQGLYGELGVRDHVHTCVNMIEESVSPKLKGIMEELAKRAGKEGFNI